MAMAAAAWPHRMPPPVPLSRRPDQSASPGRRCRGRRPAPAPVPARAAQQHSGMHGPAWTAWLPLLTTLLAAGSAADTAPAPGGEKLNVLFMIADDLRPELGAFGASHIHSPNIDALAKKSLVLAANYSMSSKRFAARLVPRCWWAAAQIRCGR